MGFCWRTLRMASRCSARRAASGWLCRRTNRRTLGSDVGQARSRSVEEIAIVRTRVENRLGQIRKSRGVGASDLARRVHVSRQTIYAIEAGTYVPNTEVALNLAHELEVTVDELFALQKGSPNSPETLAAEVLSPAAPVKGQPVRICQIGSRWISIPVSASPYYMP